MNEENLVEGLIKPKLLVNMLRYQCGHQMQCGKCGDILDYRRAVSFDVKKGNELLMTKAFCTSCFDRMNIPHVRTIAKAKGATIECVDGRLVDDCERLADLKDYVEVGKRRTFTTRTKTGRKNVRGIQVSIRSIADCVNSRGWFAYQKALRWFLVDEKTGMAAGIGGTLRGCLNSGIGQMLRKSEAELVKCFAQAEREIQ